MEIRAPTPAVRATRSYVQQLVAAPELVFPLLCPVRETEWIDGWDPRFVISASGAAEPDCVFVTAADPLDAVWMVTRHEPPRFLEMIKISPTVTACRLTIALRAAGDGCEAEVTYRHTSLGPAGDRFVAGFTDAYYVEFMRAWEAKLNHFLATGTRLRD